MFQSFDPVSTDAQAKARLTILREELAARGLSGFLVPHADEYQNEHLPPASRRLLWLTGFSGSAGAAVVLQARAAVFVDGRYTLQAEGEIDPEAFEIARLEQDGLSAWLRQALAEGDRIGYDPRLHTVSAVRRLETLCAEAGATLVACDTSPLDAVWIDRPPPPAGAVRLHGEDFSGEPAAIKIDRLRDRLGELRADVLLVSEPDCVSWLFNIRGGDIRHTPVVLARALVFRDPAQPPLLFLDPARLDKEVGRALEQVCALQPPAGIDAALADLKDSRLTVRLDPDRAAQSFESALTGGGARIQHGADPIVLMKACKNEVEIAGARAAHVRDGAALARFLAWFDREAPAGKLDEIACVEQLERFRADTNMLKDISFETIAGAGANGAIVHYRVSRATNRPIGRNMLFLVDSGGQYEDGTTDVTRTVIAGKPSDEMRDRFTRVLKGHIAVATARFPAGTAGGQIDGFARRALWDAGLDYDHGTGHGVGSYLSVHEGPARIAKHAGEPLRPGMILSNEPGYYKQGRYGIRIENLLLVHEAEGIDNGERPVLSFETLTLAPIDTRLIVPSMLTPQEVQWIDAYHERVRDTLTPLLDEPDAAWLARATRPLKV